MKQRLTYEWMIRAETDSHICRIWRGADRSELVSNDQLKHGAMIMLRDPEYTSREAGFYALCNQIVKHEGVSAVEVTEKSTGDGVCVYKNWP